MSETETQTAELIQIPLEQDDVETLVSEFNKTLSSGYVSLSFVDGAEMGIELLSDSTRRFDAFAAYASKRIDDNRSFEVFGTDYAGGTHYFSIRLPNA